MKQIRNTLNYLTTLKYIAILFLFILINNIEKKFMPYAISIYISLIALNSSIILTSVLLLLSAIIQGEFGFLAIIGIYIIYISLLKILYRKQNSNIIFLTFSSFGVLSLIFLGNTAYNIILEKKLLASLIIIILTHLSYCALNSLAKKRIKIKMSNDELISITMLTIVVGLGICNLISPLLWKGVSVFLILICSFFLRHGLTSIISTIFGISVAIFSGNINYISYYLILGLSSEFFSSYSRYLSAPTILAIDYISQIVFSIEINNITFSLIPTIISCLIFIIIPTPPLKKLKEKIFIFKEKQLVKQTINRNRLMLSNRLYELSGIFAEISATFNLLKNEKSENEIKDIITNKLFLNVCNNCNNFSKCKKNEQEVINSLLKLTDIGFAKGKLSFIDMPKELLSKCIHASDLIYGFNKLLADYRIHTIEKENILMGKQIIADETLGISEILKGLALETGSLLKYQSKLEKKLSDILLKNGFLITELLIYGEEERLSIGIIIISKEFSIIELQRTISKNIGIDMVLAEKNYITENKIYLLFKKNAKFDAIFGVSKITKDGSEISGDTYSATRISDDKFLIALSDGMGSGNKAENVSSTALSLIESFYKAGMNNNLILSTVNKLLSINTEDSFTALDISIIDLKNCTADFLKFGSPYGFIINDGGVKIIEGNTLPLGILSELKPSVCTTQLNNNDIILLVSDGISDAFGSSSEIIDFLRKIPAYNPQTLTDCLLKKALELSNKKSNDDMTAVAVRLFKKPSILEQT